MEPPDRIVSISELRRSTGERGTRMYVAYKGLVYDVTDCLRWKSGLHEGLHFPGQDLTAELGEAPHLEEIFKRPCVMVVGRLES
ncbi:MAG: cytochrome b5 domain-containing protein [Anaerolineales bacterium]